MPTFREMGRVVTAEQWHPNMAQVIEGVKEVRARGKGWEHLEEKGNTEATVETKKGTVLLEDGDWVVKVVTGDFSEMQVVKPAEFDGKYVAAVDEGGK